jgi:hypothetical protein
MLKIRRHDTQYIDTQHCAIQYNGTKHYAIHHKKLNIKKEIQLNDTQHEELNDNTQHEQSSAIMFSAIFLYCCAEGRGAENSCEAIHSSNKTLIA